ncbi:gp63 [Listeria phage A511]|uniref:Gp63 n=1 Tax=Listeria phage A511 TaxID=2908169 RepID=A8AT87_BPA51|nr:gp63 [Listeria phage A511]AAY53034.1 gp63 [Listeria phage A511]
MILASFYLLIIVFSTIAVRCTVCLSHHIVILILRKVRDLNPCTLYSKGKLVFKTSVLPSSTNLPFCCYGVRRYRTCLSCFSSKR